MAIPITINRAVMTTGIANTIIENAALGVFIAHALSRHRQGDWGDLEPGDAAANDHRALRGGRHRRRPLDNYCLVAL